MGSVRSVLGGKTAVTVLTTPPETMVFDAIALMATHSIGALVVTDNDAVVGMITERDYLRKIALQGRSSRDTPVRAIMSAPVITVSHSDTIDRCMELMTEHRIRHLPVVEGGVLVGIVSIGDCVKQKVKEQGAEIEHLQDYISGR